MALEAVLRSLYAGAAHQQIRHAGRYEGFHVVLAKAVADSLGGSDLGRGKQRQGKR